MQSNVTHPDALLRPGDGPAVSLLNPCGRSPFLLIGDHAGNRIPETLGGLGLSAPDLGRHIAWDIGVADLGAALSERLNARFVSQRFSRLVIDCNRDPTTADAIPVESDGTIIPGNRGLSSSARLRRIEEIHEDYQAEIGRAVGEGPTPILVSLHSFTPIMSGIARPWAAGVLHDGGNDGFALAVRDRLVKTRECVIGDNEPYRLDRTDFTISYHAFERGLSYVELEIRQDLLIEDMAGWAERLASALESAAELG